jgi:hypothetical protein
VINDTFEELTELKQQLEGAKLTIASIICQMGGEVRVDDRTFREMGLRPTLVTFRDESMAQQVYQVRQQKS